MRHRAEMMLLPVNSHRYYDHAIAAAELEDVRETVAAVTFEGASWPCTVRLIVLEGRIHNPHGAAEPPERSTIAPDIASECRS